MVYKSSFGRGFNSSILNSYVLSVLLCISFSITLFVLSVMDAKSLKFFRFATISFCKPIFIAVGKPFQIFNSSLIYLREMMLAKDINEEATPPVLYANASVSVPVALDAAALWNGILFFSAVLIIRSNKLF